MKLLYFLTHITNSGGMERIVIDKINYLSDHGYDISLAYFGTNNDQPFFYLNQNVKLLPIDLFIDTSSLLQKGSCFIKLISLLKSILKQEKPDVVVNANALVVSWILPFLNKNIPKVVELHFSYDGMMLMNKEYYGSNLLKSYLNNFLRNWIYPKYDKCILLTEDDKKKWKFKNSVVIPNFSNLHSVERKNNKQHNVICVGRLAPQKNINLLVEAWAIVAKRQPSWHLDIWGDGELHDKISSLIAKLKLQDCITLQGTSANLESEYSNYSFFVLPSRYEGFPLVLVEAMQFQLPCIGFNISGNRAIIEDGKNGILVNNRTPEDLANAILKLIESPQLLMEMSDYASQSIGRYTKDNVMKMWTDLFDNAEKK